MILEHDRDNSTIPSSSAGLPELPDQFVVGLLREALKALRTRNDRAPLPIVPSRGPFFLRSIAVLILPLDFCVLVLAPHRVCSKHPTRSSPGYKGCPTASRSLSLVSRTRSSRRDARANPIDEAKNSESIQK